MKDQHTPIILLYAVFFASCVLMSIIQNEAISTIGGALFLIALIAAYIMRIKTARESLHRHHLTFMIRAAWIGSFILLAAIPAVAYAMWYHGDQTAFDELAKMVEDGVVIDETMVNDAVDAYMRDNYAMIVQYAYFGFAPGLFYMLYKWAKGFTAISKGTFVRGGSKSIF